LTNGDDPEAGLRLRFEDMAFLTYSFGFKHKL